MNVLSIYDAHIVVPGHNMKSSKRSVVLRKMLVPAVKLAWTVDQIEIDISES